MKPVVETYVNETSELVHIFVQGEEIISTPSHPFYSPVKGWTDAVHLRAGDILVTVNGELVVVEKIQHKILESPITVYNFQVEGYHTYYVSSAGILVHNMCSGGLMRGKPSIPKGSIQVRNERRVVKSQQFKDFIRSTGKSFRSSEWKYHMETWVTETGEYIERHYWYNHVTGESYYHL